ncbi:MAG: class I SAM-dependent methyltransferase [Nostoc sp.]|uniref:class I SAM-dependent methyltransferase n=1 Tax=Nostoc sp. TaxID=1180 RepID=UPI002FF9F130
MNQKIEKESPIEGLTRVEYSKLLSQIRNNDHAHAGGNVHIDRLVDEIPGEHSRLLDIGCGLGGTMQHLHQVGWQELVGIDLNNASIEVARERFPNGKFYTLDAMNINSAELGWFSHFVSINTFIHISDKQQLLTKIGQTANFNARIFISDFRDLGGYKLSPISVAGSDPFSFPFENDDAIARMFDGTGWQIDVLEDVSAEYCRWYKEFANQIFDAISDIIKQIGDIGYAQLSNEYLQYIDLFERGSLGAVFIRAIWKG